MISNAATFLLRRRGRAKLHWTDIFTYAYLFLGVMLMFGPVVWLVLSSFKTQAALQEFPPTFLPLGQIEVPVDGFDKPLPLFSVTMEDGTVRELAQIRRIGIVAQMVDPANPQEKLQIPIATREPLREFRLATENYTKPLQQFNFFRFLRNSVVVTVGATIITLLINSMAAFGLSIYEFRGRNMTMGFIIGTLMIPITVILVPVFLVVTKLGMVNSLWGVILPGAATPTGVFLLRQYMLTIPRDLIDAARMDKASEWTIYWRVVMPLAMPALAVLAIFSVMWRWNEFLWPLVIIRDQTMQTLPLGLARFLTVVEDTTGALYAFSIMVLVPGLVIFLLAQKQFIAGLTRGAVKG